MTLIIGLLGYHLTIMSTNINFNYFFFVKNVCIQKFETFKIHKAVWSLTLNKKKYRNNRAFFTMLEMQNLF